MMKIMEQMVTRTMFDSTEKSSTFTKMYSFAKNQRRGPKFTPSRFFDKCRRYVPELKVLTKFSFWYILSNHRQRVVK